MHNLSELKSFLSNPKKIVIIPHLKPDADALGSCVGLAVLLTQLQHEVLIVSPTDYPEFLDWMTAYASVAVYDKQTTYCQEFIDKAEMVVLLDFSEENRIKPIPFEALDLPQKKSLLLDHHLGKAINTTFEHWSVKAAATAELVYDLALMLDLKHLINLPIAECLYAGMMTDTGSFKHPSTNSKVHRIVAELIEMGLESAKVHRLIYDNNSEDRLRLLGFALSERMVVLPALQTAYFTLARADLKRFKFKNGDSEGLVNYGLSIKGITIAAIFIEHPEEVRISFRSVGAFSVADLAKKHFNGGGHKNAAGGVAQKGLDDAVQLFVSLLNEYQTDELGHR